MAKITVEFNDGSKAIWDVSFEQSHVIAARLYQTIGDETKIEYTDEQLARMNGRD